MNIKLEAWLEPDKYTDPGGYNYWNDRDIEKEKVFGHTKCLDSDSRLNLIYRQLATIQKYHHFDIYKKTILSLGCGTCWFEGRWFADKKPIDFIGVDYSQHRVHGLAVKTLDYYEVKGSMRLVLGDVTDLKIEDGTIDVILMINSFHNIGNPNKLMTEIKRVSHADTKILIMAEPFHSYLSYIKVLIKYAIDGLTNYKTLRHIDKINPPLYRDMFPSNRVMGDTHYTKNQYLDMFKKMGEINIENHIDRKCGLQSFVLTFSK